MSITLRGIVAAAGATVLLLAMPGTAQAHHRTGDEPTQPYAQPANADVPRRGCQTIAAPPTAPPASSIPSFQVIYAWHDGDGNHYEESVEQIATIVDRIDWSLDNSTDYDQHINFSCTRTPASSYSDYARALVVPEKIEAGTNPMTSAAAIRSDLVAAGYDDSSRYYLVFTDFESESSAFQCPTIGGLSAGGNQCSAVVELWDSGVAGHELGHVLGAGHPEHQETGTPYVADIMYGWWDYWMFDQDFNTYYDPSELSASFYIDKHPSTTKRNIANHPALTAPTCCDVGFSNDLLTAQERTIEANAPGSAPTGFTVTGGASFRVTPAGGDPAISSRYYDGRRSLTVNVTSGAAGHVSVTRRPPVTAGSTYRFFARLTTSTAGNVRLRISWYNSSNTLISHSPGPLMALTSAWEEYDYTATAPAGATRAQLAVASPAGQTFAYIMDTLNFNLCNSPNTPDGCRTAV